MPLGAARAEDAKCCFTNPGHSGVCEVTPAKDETCATILTYLNTPNSVGKGYCAGTNIRGGWQSATCKPESKKEGTTGPGPVASVDRPGPRQAPTRLGL
jgi:hypothetical protein